MLKQTTMKTPPEEEPYCAWCREARKEKTQENVSYGICEMHAAQVWNDYLKRRGQREQQQRQ